jgi:hypothetical protein
MCTDSTCHCRCQSSESREPSFPPAGPSDTLEGPMYLRRRDRHIFLSSQASQPHYFKIHLGVIFLSCPINMGMTLSQTVSTADLKLPFVRKQIYISRSGFRKANYIRKRIREANYIRKRIGSGLEADWKRIGSGLEADWKRIESKFRWRQRHATYDIRRFSA